MGDVPQKWAKAASDRSRCGLSPAVTKSVPATVRTDTKELDEGGSGLVGETEELGFEDLDLGCQRLIAAGK